MYSFAIITLFFSSESCPSCSQLSSKPKLSAPSHREGTYLHHAHFCVRALRVCHFLAGSKRMCGLPCRSKSPLYLSINASLSSGAWSSAEIFAGNFFYKFFLVFLNASCPYQMEQHRSKRHKHNTNATVKLAVDREQTHALQTMEPDAPPIYFWVTIIKLRMSAFWMRVRRNEIIIRTSRRRRPLMRLFEIINKPRGERAMTVRNVLMFVMLTNIASSCFVHVITF